MYPLGKENKIKCPLLYCRYINQFYNIVFGMLYAILATSFKTYLTMFGNPSNFFSLERTSVPYIERKHNLE